MEKNKEVRNHGVTIAKALAIMLMVLGHSGCPEEINHFLGIMRMPLFFLMSGYCFKSKYITDGRQYLTRRVKGVYKPYVKWGLFFLLCHNLFCEAGLYSTTGDNATALYGMNDFLHHALTIIVCMSPEEQLIGGFWFLHDLFWGSLIFYFSMKLLRKEYVTIVLLFAVTMILSYLNIHLSYFIYPRTVLASVFITAGYAFKKGGFTFERPWWFIAGTTILIAIVSCFWHSNFLEFTWMDVPPYTVLAILGSLMIFSIGEHLNDMKPCAIKRFLIFVGGKTFTVLTWHMLALKIVTVVLILTYGLSWSEISAFPTIEGIARKGWFIVYFCIGVIVPIIWIYYYDRIKSRLYSKE